jgi:D-tyrosyl-tRNA(Tyr) deacylase
MRILLQRVTRAEVRVDGASRGAIADGLVALVGIGPDDDDATVTTMAGKCVDLRIFRDEEGRTNRSLEDVGGAMLIVSQFTLFGDTRKGRRPSFIGAATPEHADRLVDVFADAVAARGIPIARGVFGAEMEVDLVNDGPMTIWLDTGS